VGAGPAMSAAADLCHLFWLRLLRGPSPTLPLRRTGASDNTALVSVRPLFSAFPASAARYSRRLYSTVFSPAQLLLPFFFQVTVV